MKKAAFSLFPLLFSLGIAGADAQGYPSKPVRIISPFAPGGGNDALCRIIAQRLGENLKQQIIVENRAGANGIVGTEVAARSAPDGYTIVLVPSGHAVNASLYKKLPFDSIRDFSPITLAGSSPLVLAVHPSLPARNVKDLIALARARPEQLTYVSAGIGASGHLGGALFETLTGTKMTHIPYKGQGQAITDVVTGEIQFMFNSPSAVKSFIDAKRLRVLGITSDKRSPQMPEVPTFAESGFKDLVTGSWYAVWLPAKTPDAIVSRLNAEIVRITKLPEVSKRIVELGGVPVANSPAEMDAFQKAEATRWAKVVKASGAKLD